MPFVVKTRHGAEMKYADDADIPAVVERPVRELETEPLEEPDDEHTHVGIRNGEWAVTVRVSGLMTLDDLGWITGSDDDLPTEKLFLRAASRSKVVEMLTLIAKGGLEGLRSMPWTPLDRVPPCESDLFRAKRGQA